MTYNHHRIGKRHKRIHAGNTMEIPYPSDTVLIAAAIILSFLFCLSIWLEIHKKRTIALAHIAAQWRAIEDITHDRGLSAGQRDLLRYLIESHAPDNPLRAATARQHFNDCIEAEMEALSQEDDIDLYKDAATNLREIRIRLALDYVPVGQRITSTRELIRNQSLWLSPRKREASSDWLKARVTAVDEGFFRVAPDASRAEDLPPSGPAGTVRCHMWREDDARYAFGAKLAHMETAPPQWTFYHTSDLNRLQARGYYRINHTQDADLDLLKPPPDGESAPRVLKTYNARIVNVSAGGYAAVTDDPLPSNASVRTSLNLRGEDPIEAHAIVVAVEPLARHRFLVRAQYSGMEEETRDIIARYVMHAQQAASAAEHDD